MYMLDLICSISIVILFITLVFAFCLYHLVLKKICPLWASFPVIIEASLGFSCISNFSIYSFFNVILAVLGVCCHTWAFSSVVKQGALWLCCSGFW